MRPFFKVDACQVAGRARTVDRKHAQSVCAAKSSEMVRERDNAPPHGVCRLIPFPIFSFQFETENAEDQT